ncbi:MAG: hypothetical protein KBS76_00315 [Ruminococcus sp.]|nr:hypothetical protein [Candidatus Apopatosoma intestinale]
MITELESKMVDEYKVTCYDVTPSRKQLGLWTVLCRVVASWLLAALSVMENALCHVIAFAIIRVRRARRLSARARLARTAYALGSLTACALVVVIGIL